MGMQTGLLGRSSTIYRYLGYTDMNELGVVVQLVDKVSAPLFLSIQYLFV